MGRLEIPSGAHRPLTPPQGPTHSKVHSRRPSLARNQCRLSPLERARGSRPCYQNVGNASGDSRTHLRLIPQDLWDGVQARLAAVTAKYKGKGGAPGTKSARPFSGLMACGMCGRPMVHSGGSTSVYYRCSGAHSGRCCPNRAAVREDTLKQVAIAELRRVLTETTLYDELRSRIELRLKSFAGEVDDERGRLTRQLTRVTGEVERLVRFVRTSEPGSRRWRPLRPS